MTRARSIILFLIVIALAPVATAESARSTVNPGSMYEYPPSGSGGIALDGDDVVDYVWTAKRADGLPLKVRFNVHYNEGAGEVRYAVGPAVSAGEEASFTAPQKDGYYFMWENTQPTPVDIVITYARATDPDAVTNATPAVPLALVAPALVAAAVAVRRRLA